MGFFNEKLAKSLLSGLYTCSECGGRMEFEDDNEDVLVCPKCGHSVELEEYGFEHPEDYNDLYPTKDEFYDSDEDDDDSAPYEEVHGELSGD